MLKDSEISSPITSPVHNQKHPFGFLVNTRIGQVLLFIAILAIGTGLFQFINASNHQPVVKEHDAPVSVATATIEDVPITIRSIGNVLPFSFVNVVPQVGGQLKQVLFKQGDYVKTGQLLFQIDPAPYEASFKQAEGNVMRDKAQILQAQANQQKDLAQVGQLAANLTRDQATTKFANVERSRYNYLQQQGAVSYEQSDQQSTNAAVADANVAADKKAIENAKAVVRADEAAIETAQANYEADKAAAENAHIQLSWTTIRSPLDGLTGSLNVYEGNVVVANNATPLVTINQVRPIYVNFTVPEQYLDEIRKNLTRNTLSVDVLVEGKRKNAVVGQVSFLNNTVSTTTGTIMLRVAFDNTDLRLFPGQFVDVIVSMPPSEKTVVIPTQAIQTTQQGTAVFIVDPDNTVRFSTVEVARTDGDKAALTSGVKPGEVVVTDGQLQLVPGSKVKVVPGSG